MVQRKLTNKIIINLIIYFCTRENTVILYNSLSKNIVFWSRYVDDFSVSFDGSIRQMTIYISLMSYMTK